MPRPESPSLTALVPAFGAVLALAAAGAAHPITAQERQVVSNRVTVSDSDATLSLEFDSGPALDISFQDGDIRVNGEYFEGYEPGGALEAAWRTLLSEVVPLNDGPLAAALLAWEPGGALEAETRLVGTLVDGVLEDALAGSAPDRRDPALQPAVGAQRDEAAEAIVPPLLRLLLQADPESEEALRGVDLSALSLHVGEDVTVDAGGLVDGTLLVVDGDATIAGEVPGSVVLVDGTLRIEEGALIRGEVLVINGRLQRDGGRVEGTIRNLGAMDSPETEARADEDATSRGEDGPRARDAEGGFGPLRHITSGLGGLFRDAFWLVIVLAVSLVVVHFAGNRLRNVAAVARTSPGRSALVGLAGTFLLLPVWVLGILALAISIIGIPLLIVWLPLFPLAVLLAQGLGYLAVASVVGEWLARKDIPALDRFRSSNQLHVLAIGLAALVLPSAFSHVAEMGGPSLGSLLSVVFSLVAAATAMVALMVGFGAVLLTGAGRTSDPQQLASAYGQGIRATRIWTRRGSRRSANREYGRGGVDRGRSRGSEHAGERGRDE